MRTTTLDLAAFLAQVVREAEEEQRTATTPAEADAAYRRTIEALGALGGMRRAQRMLCQEAARGYSTAYAR